ncbi:MAG TPA: pantoate--beta-alanine ligase [Candidatus Omnitrophota bacterium]|nr:pantoate--beta-alanine ligase [Candidatus Omnitrophota bacterium]HRZ15381.1 pantoate--beta-alanine ligase [Candidatus Omnitrophota bacterium]
MQVIKTIKKMQATSLNLKRTRASIGFVPTMGALHEGHLSLIRRSRRENDVTVVSIFVNPIQFGPSEDLNRYPRPLQQDLRLCMQEKVEYVFCPRPEDMYPEGFKTFVEVRELGAVLCGASRPTHFRGVTTVVAKLFNAVFPDRAYFGQKDCQQAVIIERMARDLNFPVMIEVLPIIRERSGLALSSRNAYLDPAQKKDALVLSKALSSAAVLIRGGTRDAARIKRVIRTMVSAAHSVKIDYIAIVDKQTLKPVKKIQDSCLIALAMWIGKTRLIDNIVVNAQNRKAG